MQLPPFTDGVRAQLLAAAALGDERTQQTAQALATAADPAVRLAVLEAVSAVADEITAALLDVPGAPAVSVRLEADEVRIDVRTGPPAEPAPPAPDESENDARISLRLPESLKDRIDTAARAAGVSVNTWLLRAATSALGPGRSAHTTSSGPGRISGWING